MGFDSLSLFDRNSLKKKKKRRENYFLSNPIGESNVITTRIHYGDCEEEELEYVYISGRSVAISRASCVFARVSKLKGFADTYPLDTCPIRLVDRVVCSHTGWLYSHASICIAWHLTRERTRNG